MSPIIHLYSVCVCVCVNDSGKSYLKYCNSTIIVRHTHTPVVGLYGDLCVTINQAQALIWDRSGFLLPGETCS